MPEVSIIVPVYNAEKTIGRCIESILNQEYTDFELILCNDGSRDKSGQICDEYAEKDSRIHVIHKENSGVSDTRNVGIRSASGTYIQFLDADDWITVDATKLLVRTMKEKESDLVISDFYRVVGEHISRKGDIDTEEVMSTEKFAKFMMENPADFYYGVLWNKLYKRELIESYEIYMDEQLSWCEDFLFNLEYLLHCKTVAALQVPIYYYVKTEGSLATQGMNIAKTVKMKITVFEYYNEFYKHIYEEKDYDKSRLGVYRFLVDAATDGIVIPNALAGTKRLGEERAGAYIEEDHFGDLFTDYYRVRKWIEQHLEAVAMKYDLDVKDVTLLAYLPEEESLITRKELADYTGYSVRVVSGILQKLMLRKMVIVKRVKNMLSIQITEEYASLKRELAYVREDYQMVCFQDFSEKEARECQNMNRRMQENIKRVLVKKY